MSFAQTVNAEVAMVLTALWAGVAGYWYGRHQMFTRAIRALDMVRGSPPPSLGPLNVLVHGKPENPR